MSKGDFFLKRRLHSLMNWHFGFGQNARARAYTWLKSATGKSHVSDLNRKELHAAISKVPRSSFVRPKTWDRLKK